MIKIVYFWRSNSIPLKKLLFILAFVSLASCQLFDSKVPDEDALLQKRLKEINWKEVSAYPSLAECDSLLDKQQKKECFFATMARLVQEKLGADTLAMLSPQLDTINVKVTVFNDSRLEFEPQLPQDSVGVNVAKIDSILKVKLVDFPKIEPAQKEGVPVTTQFILPVVVSQQP